MIGQLALVIYMWVQKDKYLQIMGDVVEKAWDRRTRRADYMDAIQISVSARPGSWRFGVISKNTFLLRRWSAVDAVAMSTTPSRATSRPLAARTPITAARRPSTGAAARLPSSSSGTGTATSSSMPAS